MFDKSIGSGTYLQNDILFLLNKTNIVETPVNQKEIEIQLNKKHYSEMISREESPSKEYMDLYQDALAINKERFASNILSLSKSISKYLDSEITLVSLVRAGVPIGVLLNRVLQNEKRKVNHYGISIIRDKGIDRHALNFILERHAPESIIFIDGWTGKGAIANELEASLSNDTRFKTKPKLAVLTDPCGRAWLSAGHDDWVIPCGFLGSIVSGLVSRSIWKGDHEPHACMINDHLRQADISLKFINVIEKEVAKIKYLKEIEPLTDINRIYIQNSALQVIAEVAQKYNIQNLNRIKPGISEATRAVLRRAPERIILGKTNNNDIKALKYLANQRNVKIERSLVDLGPYQVITLIKGINE